MSADEARTGGDLNMINNLKAKGNIEISFAASPPEVPSASDEELAEALTRYAEWLRKRYGRLDLEVLTPLSEQDDHPPVELKRVFVPQSVRSDPPQRELPRELLHRLVQEGNLEAADLPPGLEPADVERIRQSYLRQPARPVLRMLSAPGGARTVLLGDPGAGKSTLARYLALALTQSGQVSELEDLADHVPVLVELRLYAQEGAREQTFEDFIAQLHATEAMGLPMSVLQRCFQEGKALVIFDGLDELFDPGDRDRVARRIAGFAARYPGIRIVVTSREIGYRRPVLEGAGFTHFKLQDLDRAQIETFFKGWFKNAFPDRPDEAARLRERVTKAVDRSASVRELAGNPLILTILAIIGRRRELPRDRRAVYEHAVAVLVEHWDPSKFLTDQLGESMPYLGSEDRVELLRLVARRMQQGQSGMAGNHIAGSDLIGSFEDYLRDRYELPADQAAASARLMLKQFHTRNFILSRFGGDVYGFVHRAFLEYLAAADIERQFANRQLTEDELLEVFNERWQDASWHEVLLLLVGIIPEQFAARAIDRLLTTGTSTPSVEDKHSWDHLFLAVRYLGEIRKLGTLTAQSQAVTQGLIRMLTWGAAQGYVPAYVHAGVERIRPTLTSLGPHWAGRQYLDWYEDSAYQLGGALGEIAARLGTALLEADPNGHSTLRRWAGGPMLSECRSDALRALVESWPTHPETLPFVRDRAVFDSDSGCRTNALRALVEWWADAGTSDLVRDRALNDADSGCRTNALRALVERWSDENETNALIRKQATEDRDSFVRTNALHLLVEQWPDAAGTGDLVRDRALNDADSECRTNALRALVEQWPDEEETRALIRKRATEDRDSSVRTNALRALVDVWPDQDETRILVQERAARDGDSGCRDVAVRALVEQWGDRDGTRTLIQERAISDSDSGCRDFALRALVEKWADHPETRALIQERAAEVEDSGFRRSALRTLVEQWPDQEDTRILLQERAAEDSDGGCRNFALGLLAEKWADHPEAVAVIRERAVVDSDSGCRIKALDLLVEGRAAAREMFGFVRDRAIDDPDDACRIKALSLLAKGLADHPGAISVIRDRARRDRERACRTKALSLLAERWADHPGTVDLIQKAIVRDRDSACRIEALSLLAEGWAEDPGTVGFIHKRAVHDPERACRDFSLRLLARKWADHPETFAVIRDRVMHDPEQACRGFARRLLAEQWAGHPETPGLVRERANHGSDSSLRRLRDLSERVPGDVSREGGIPRTLQEGQKEHLLTGMWVDHSHSLDHVWECAHDERDVAKRVKALRLLTETRVVHREAFLFLREYAIHDADSACRIKLLRLLGEEWADHPEARTFIRERAIHDMESGCREFALSLLPRAERSEASASYPDHAGPDSNSSLGDL